MEATIRDEDGYVYIDIVDAAPNTETYLNVRSKPVPPNQSNEDVTLTAYKTSDEDGSCTFKFSHSALLLDENLPREVSVNGVFASEMFTARG